MAITKNSEAPTTTTSESRSALTMPIFLRGRSGSIINNLPSICMHLPAAKDAGRKLATNFTDGLPLFCHRQAACYCLTLIAFERKAGIALPGIVDVHHPI